MRRGIHETLQVEIVDNKIQVSYVPEYPDDNYIWKGQGRTIEEATLDYLRDRLDCKSNQEEYE